MNPTENGPPGPPHGDRPRVLRALQESRDPVGAGRPPARPAFLARHAAIAAALAPCLDAVELVEAAGPRVHTPAPEPRPETSSAPEGDGPALPLGDFRLVREVGRGGMGGGYEAGPLSLGRRGALQILPLPGTLDPRQLQRFRQEAQAAAQLHHTNIVPVYAVGCERGVHYYAMQFIDGQDLAAVIGQLRRQAGLPADADGRSESVP